MTMNSPGGGTCANSNDAELVVGSRRCSKYDSFKDESRESTTEDPSFARKKLADMRCCLKRLELEKLELESQTRSLKLALQEFGVDVDMALKPDPLVAHLKAEGRRLAQRKDELKDEVRDLRETLAERGDGSEMPDERILAIRRRYAVEKRQ